MDSFYSSIQMFRTRWRIAKEDWKYRAVFNGPPGFYAMKSGIPYLGFSVAGT
jgi:hypothetical protein